LNGYWPYQLSTDGGLIGHSVQSAQALYSIAARWQMNVLGIDMLSKYGLDGPLQLVFAAKEKIVVLYIFELIPYF
jgi:hypothetical protein